MVSASATWLPCVSSLKFKLQSTPGPKQPHVSPHTSSSAPFPLCCPPHVPLYPYVALHVSATLAIRTTSIPPSKKLRPQLGPDYIFQLCTPRAPYTCQDHLNQHGPSSPDYTRFASQKPPRFFPFLEETAFLKFYSLKLLEMENNWGIMGLREDEIELDLGLSIGGSFGKAQKLKPIKNESKPNNNTVADLGESVAFDPQTKRELQALRRQEARKKREHKQQKRGTCHRNGEFHIKDDGANATEERECKKTKVQEFPVNGNPNFSAELNSPLVCPVIPVRVPCPYPPLQFVPLGNGFAYSCVNAVPCWGGVAGNEKGAVQPVAVAVNGGFPSFQTAQDLRVNGGNGYYSEQNSSRDERKRKTGSNGSPMYSSSTASDLQSSSNQ
ncbi:hypothetical protein Golax_017048, partial [Gossypium laxum]|nr:hypothetical protein [Gossypium laxum]